MAKKKSISERFNENHPEFSGSAESTKNLSISERFDRNHPGYRAQMYTPSQMPTDDAVRTVRRTTEQDNAVRSLAVERMMEQSNKNVVGPATRRDVSIPIPFIGNVKIQNGDHFRENNLSKTTPVREVGYNPTVSPYTTSVADRLKAQIEGTPVNKDSVDQALAKLLKQKQSDAESYYADKDISEKPVSMLTDEEKQAIKDEYESIDNHNFFQTRGDLALNDETARKQQLYSNYREIKNEDAYTALKLHGMSDAEIQMLNGNPLSEEEINQLQMQGKTDDEINRIANARSLEMEKARSKYEALIASVDDSWGVSVDDITNMIEDRYANPEVQKMALESPVASSVYTLGANPFESAAEVGANVYNYMTGRPVQNYQTGTELIRNAITEDIDSQLGKTAYGGVMSIGDMAVAMGLAYGTGGGSIVNAGIQALEKASQVMGEGVDRGLTPDQIFAEGIASGVTTYLTEKVPYGMFERVAKKGLTNYTAKEIGKYLGSMFMSEGLQEASEDVADWAVDAVVAWDKNEFNTDVQSLISQGMKPEDAAMKVISDRFTEATTDFVIGGIGGAHMGSVSTGIANYLGKVNNNPSVYTNKILNSPAAFREMINAVNSIDTSNLEGEDLTRVEHAKEVAQEIANKPKKDIKEEQIVDIANVLNEQANPENDLANTINSINYQASFDTSKQEYEKNKSITPVEGETEIERLARKNAESIAVREDKRQQEAQRQREKELLDYQINGLKSKLGKALNNFAEEFENEYAAKTFLENFKDQNAALYSSASLQAYRAGETGQSFATFLENSTEAKIMLESGLSEAYLKTLYYQGQNTRTEEDSLNFRVVQNPNRGLATGGEDELTPLKQKIAKVLGVEVATDFEKAATRGDFSVAIAKIMVNATADNQYTALMHEVFEFARAYNPKGMKLAQKTLVDMLVKKTGERAFFDAVMDYREAYRKAGKDAKNNKSLNPEEKAALMKEANKTTDEAQEEFINDAIAYIFTTDEGIKALTDFLMSDENTTQKEKVSAIQAIKDFVDHLIKTIKNFISKKDNKQLGYKYAEYANFSTEELEKVSRLLTGVLDEARKNLARMTKEQSVESAKENKNKNANVPKSIEISKSELNENLHKVHDMEAIGPVEFYDYVKKTRAEGTSELLQHITSKGKTYANVDKLGKVYVDNGGIKDILRHGKAEVSGSLIEAIIPVLEKGKIVYADYDHKSKNYNTATIVAPVEFKNDGYGANKAGTYYVGVIVKRSPSSPVENQNLHVVDILTIRKGLPNNGPTNNGRIPDAANLNLNDILNYVAADVNIFGDEGSIKFSLDVPVEQTKDLIAVHNLSDEKLMGVLELGGFPMPSIAITKANMDHSKFGPISVVFRRETIDPKANKANKVYSGDAYTPTFPRTGYKVDSNKVWDIENRLSNIMGDMKDAFGYLGIDPDNVTDYLERNNGNAVDAYANKDGLKYAFVKDKGLDFDAPTKEKQLSYKFDNEEIKYIALMFTKEEALKAFQNASETYKEFSADGRLQKIIEKINAVEKKTLGKFYENHKTTELSFSDFDTLLNSIVRYNREGIEQEIDRKAFNEKIKGIIEKNRSEYEKWVKDLFDGVIIKKGLRNNKDAFTSSGNRRSWDALHYDYTLDNIVKAMKEEPEVGQSLGGYTLLGSVNRKFDSVADIHSEENRLQKMDDDQYSALRGQIQDALYEVAKGLKPNPSWDVLSICSDIAEAAAKRKTRSGIKNFLSEWYSVSEEDMDEIMRIIDEAKSLPTGYFEAKPQRAVGLDEVAAVVLPSDDAEMKKLLDEKNIPVVEYTRGDKQSRIDAVNSVEDIRFSLSVSVDSEGNKLSEGQQAFFADSKVRDEQGRLMRMYHGTPNGTFTVFRGGTYFTNMAWYADRYQNQGASSLGYKKTADNPKTYAAYLNITKPFDTRDPKVRKIWDEQYYQKWDTGEITERGLPDWTSAEGLIEFIEENGYDFDGIIIDEGGVEDGKGGVTSRGFAWIPLKGEDQVKDINNLNPTNNPDYRFSLPVTDSTGRKLSEGQRRFFRNSKVLDDNGNLKAMYHGTERGGFTVFDPEFSDDGISLFFTDDKDIAKAYSGTDKEIKLYRTVKDLEELIHDSYTHIVKDGNTYRIINGFDDDAETEFEGTFDELKEYVEEQYGVEEATNYKVYLNAENPLIIDAEGNNWDEIPEVVKGLTTTREYAVYAKENGYDSVIINNVVDSGVNADSGSRYKNTQVVIVFDSNQVKSVDNLNPTDNLDIRHSIDVIDPFFDAFQEIDEEVKLDESDLEKFIKEKMDLDSDVTQKAVQEVAKNIKKAYGSNIRTDRLAGDIMSVFRYLKSTGNMSMKDLMFVMQDIARPVLEDVKASDPEQEKMYKDFVNTVKKYKISLDAGQMAEVANSFGSYYEFQRAMRGKINLSKDGGTPLDNIWTEICDVSNGHLSYGTNPNDQPLALAEYIHSLAPTYQTQEGESLDDAATDLALEIFRQFYVYQSMTDAAAKVKGELNRRSNEYKNKYKKAYNDAIKQVEAERNLNIQRLANELDDLTAEEQEAIRNGDAINQAVIKNLKEDYQRRLDRLRAQSNERIAREKAKYQNAWITKNLRRERSELKNRVLREVKALQNMIAHPAEGASKHVPINLIKPTIEMLEAINLDNGGRNKAIAERLKKMAEVYETFKSEEYSFDYDERIAGDIKELQEMFEGKSYADLQITELERVIEIVVALKTQIRNANNLILNGKLKDAQEAASSAMTSVRQSRRYDNAAMNALNKYANIHLNAYREFRKLSGYDEGSLMEIYRDLDEGSKKEMQIQKDLGEIFQSVLEGKENQKEVKKFISTKKEDLVDIGMKDRNGKPLLITRAMRMSLIMHSMNAGNMRHVLGSGITIPNMYYFEKGKMDEAYAKGINYRFVDYAELLDAIQKNNTAKIEELTKKAQERVEALKNDLSPWEQRFLAAAEEMFHEKTGQYINETSMALKGYAIARVKNYFPIKTDSHFTSQDWSGLVQNASLEGAGVLKERVISTKPILLEDITNVIERQIRFTSKYAGLAVAIRNFDTIMKQISRGGDGQLHNLYETIDSVWGASDTKWLRNLMQDLQGGRSEARSWLMNLRGQFAGATLTLNPSVAIKQAASYPTAAAVVGYKALGRALADMRKGFITKEGLPELEKINPLLWYRNLGNGTQELADAKAVGFGKNLPQWAQKAVNWTQWFDTGTVRTLEYAAKYYVDENYKGLKEGTEAYWEKVSEVFTKVVEETQPNYSTLHKADIIRNPNSFVKMLVMFKTQPMQNFGIVYDALGELNAAKHSGNKKWIDEASSNAARAISSQVVSATVFSAMSILSQLLLHRWWKYRDDDEKWSWEKFWVALGEGALSCMTGAFIGGSELYEALKHIFTGNTYYGIEVSVAEMVNDFVDNVGNLTKNAKALWESNTSEEKEKAAQKILKSSLNLGATVGEFEGTPVNNIKNMLSAMYFYATDIVRSIDEGELSFSNDSNIADWEIETQYERIYQALNNNDTEKYEKLVNELKAKVTDENPDLTEDEVAEKVAESVTKKIVSMVKAEYLEGTKSEEEVTEYLEDAKGMDEDDAYFQIKKWEGNSNSEYKVMNDAIEVAADDPTPENRKAVIEEINGLVEHGKEKKNIADSIQRAYKDKYIELYEQGNATNLNAILRTALVTAGFSDEEAKEKISGWLK